MKRIVRLENLDHIIRQIHHDYKTIVLVGGCFDILHIGHIKFLKEAREKGDFLIVLLESDEKVRFLKGQSKPLFNQMERADVLTAITSVDMVILLPYMKKGADYNYLISKIKPSVIAMTEKDPLADNKIEQAKIVHGEIMTIPHFKTFSSSKLAGLLGVD